MNSGSTFEFYAAGSIQNSDRLRFTGGTTVNVDDATLKFHESGIDFGQSTFNMTNNALLVFQSSGTKITAENLNLTDSSIDYSGGDIQFKVDHTTLTDSAINVSTGKFETLIVEVKGSNTFTGLRLIDKIKAQARMCIFKVAS